MKMASQRFCLRWNNHQSNLLSVFDQLLHAETFTDVTLAVEGQYLRAHKMVLSACSPYFNALFINHPEKHPIVILKDVPYADMKSLLDFMYRGEVSVDQERLTAFLRVAESLRIKGLTEVNDEKPTSNETQPPQFQRIQPYLVQQQNKNAYNQSQGHLNSSLSLPKRKRGRPRKLSGSSNGTGDYDDYDREETINDDLEGNRLNETLSTHEDASDDYQRDSDNNENATARKKRSKGYKETQAPTNQNDNSTSGIRVISDGKLESPTPRCSINAGNFCFASTMIEGINAGIGLNLCDKEGSSINFNDMSEKNNCELNQIVSEEDKHADFYGKNVLVTVVQPKDEQCSLNKEEVAKERITTYSPSSPVNNQNVPQEDHKSPQQIFFYQNDDKLAENKCSDNPSNCKKDAITAVPPLEFFLIESTQKMSSTDKAVDLDITTKKIMTTNITHKNPLLTSTLAQKNITSVTRRRIRRKAQSTIDDQAEHLTEMSVRGLDLFRYASIIEGVYQCTECAKGNIQKTFKNKYSFQRHAFLYHEGKHRKVFPCNICGKEFSRPDKMKNHIKMTHESYAAKDVEQVGGVNYLKSVASNVVQSKILKQRLQRKKSAFQHFQEQLKSIKKNDNEMSTSNVDNNIISASSLTTQSLTPELPVSIQLREQNLQ